MKILALSLIVLATLPRPALAEEVLLAVASNFVTAAEALAETFEATSDHSVVVAHGSTGALYAQIVSGAPYDVFLSADAERPRLLGEAGLAADVTTYALGRLVLVSKEAVDLDTASEDFANKRVALADPMVAPYGAAAIAAMENLALDTATFQPLLVTNVGQVATLFVTGNADLAFLAEAQLPFVERAEVTALDGRYPEIRQDAALLTRSEGNPAALAFWAFLASDAAAEVIVANGYDLAE
ncbi:MAG: molybdate ABC transporter substrate-binding protein [Boseongicola sp.]|nr:molybdate ABC transporter substrate-binding protein [Boseongicola sp.]